MLFTTKSLAFHSKPMNLFLKPGNECKSMSLHGGAFFSLLIQNFYHGLVPLDRSHLDAAAGGAFFSLNLTDARALIEKMVSNQGWSNERLQPRKRGMHSLKEADMLATKVDLLTKILENCEKMSAPETIQAMDTHMICEVCGETEHSGNFYPKTREDLNFINNDNGFHPQN